MSDFKSKLPDLKELASMTSKLFTDIKKSVGEIVHNYKENRAQQEEVEQTKEEATQKPVKENKAAAEPAKPMEPVETIEVVEPKESKKESKADDTKQ